MSWYFRQLFPLRYEVYYEDADGVEWRCQWRMWFGRCFDTKHERVDEILL